MLERSLSKKVLSLGPDRKGKGGMASVLSCYHNYIYNPFYFERTTTEGSLFVKFLLFLKIFFVIPYYVFIKKVKIIHIHGASERSFYRKKALINYASLFPVDIIFHLHGGKFQIFAENYGEKKIAKVFSKITEIIVLSEEWEHYIKNTIGCKNVTIVNNIIPFPKLQERKTNDSVIRFLFMGMIRENKGIFDLLRAINMSKEYLTGKILLIIGGTSDNNDEISCLKNYIKEQNLETLVDFRGWIGEEDKISLYNQCNIFVLPSYIEGLPVSILEAMSYQEAIISTKVGGIPEIVVSGENGYLIEPGDINALNKIILELANNKLLVEKFGKSSGIKAAGFFPDKVEIQLRELYNKILIKQNHEC